MRMSSLEKMYNIRGENNRVRECRCQVINFFLSFKIAHFDHSSVCRGVEKRANCCYTSQHKFSRLIFPWENAGFRPKLSHAFFPGRSGPSSRLINLSSNIPITMHFPPNSFIILHTEKKQRHKKGNNFLLYIGEFSLKRNVIISVEK